jgi:hypothetical protein
MYKNSVKNGGMKKEEGNGKRGKKVSSPEIGLQKK